MAAAIRFCAALGLIGAGAMHALWATGSAWPARDRKRLADAMVGSPNMPPAAACLVVAAGLSAAGVLVAGAGGDRRAAVRARTATGLALIARGVAGGAVAGKLLRLPSPSARFRSLDSRFYRPGCCALGAATLVGRATK